MSSATIDTPRIERFCALVNKGIEAWVEAGQLLCEMVRDDPAVYSKILSDNPHLTRDILSAFERVGRREVYPYLLLDQSPGARLLMALPHDDQVRLYSGKVTVVVNNQKVLESRQKRVCDLTKVEAERVFDGYGVRPVALQMELARAAFKRGTPSCSSRKPKIEAATAPSAHEGDAGNLEEPPRDALIRFLGEAHDKLLEARTALAMVQRESKWDQFITAALTSIGKLRFGLHEKEI